MVLLDNIWVLKFLSCVKDVGEEGHTLNVWGLEENLKNWTSVFTFKQELSFFIASYSRLSVPQASGDSPGSASCLVIKGIADICCCTGCVWVLGNSTQAFMPSPTQPALTFDFKITSDSRELTEILHGNAVEGITEQSGNIDYLSVK